MKRDTGLLLLGRSLAQQAPTIGRDLVNDDELVLIQKLGPR